LVAEQVKTRDNGTAPDIEPYPETRIRFA
jgi:hypothetical protein